VARIARREAITVRKPEKGTLPKVIYLAAEEAAIQPEIATRPFIYKEGQVLLRPIGAVSPDPERPGDARVDYDTPHVKPWGLDMALYLLTKGIATGTMLVSLLLPLLSGDHSRLTLVIGPAISLVALSVTALILVADLERPERFYYILVHPNWRSWMVWGAYFLTIQGAITALWLAAAWFDAGAVIRLLYWPAVVASILTTCYTGFLFAQGLARDLWQGPHATVDLLAQAIVEGAAVLLLVSLIPGVLADPGFTRALAVTIVVAMAAHLALIVVENLLTPSPTRHHELATSAIVRGPLARLFWGGAVAAAALSAIVALVGVRASPGNTCGWKPARACLFHDLPVASRSVAVGRLRRSRVDELAEKRPAPLLDRAEHLFQLRVGVRNSRLRRQGTAHGQEDRRQPRPPRQPRTHVRQGRRHAESARGSGPHPLPAEAGRGTRLGQVAPGVVGRGARRHRHTNQESRRRESPPRGHVSRGASRRRRLREPRPAGLGD
jgi:formate-dependent nitrite reductase membrane component NrfD